MNKTVKLTYLNSKNEGLSFKFQTLENVPVNVIEIWSKKLIEFIDSSNTTIQTKDSNFGYPQRSPEVLISKLKCIISYINNSELVTKYEYPKIKEEIPEDYPVEIHNEIHHHFEKLIGQVGSESDWWKLITSKCKDPKLESAILSLNEITHELEECVSNPDTPSHLKYMIHSIDLVELPKEVENCLSLGAQEGAVYLNYTQRGKTIEEVVQEDDDYIEPDNIIPYKLCNGSFTICFNGNDNNIEKQIKMRSELKNKLIDKNYGIDTEKHAREAGRPLIGKVLVDDIQKLKEDLLKFPKLHKIEIDGKIKEVAPYIDHFE